MSSTPRPFIPVPNTASVELIFINAAEYNENVIHVRKASPFTLADLQALRVVVDTWDSGTGKGFRNSSAQLYRIRTRALDTQTSPMEDYYLPTPRGGTAGASAQGLSLAFCLKLDTGQQGRSQRGRLYMGNLCTTQLLDAGHIQIAVVSNFVAGYTTLKSNLAAAGYTWVVTSFRHNKQWRTQGSNTDVQQIVAIDNVLDSQRRRLPGRGHFI